MNGIGAMQISIPERPWQVPLRGFAMNLTENTTQFGVYAPVPCGPLVVSRPLDSTHIFDQSEPAPKPFREDCFEDWSRDRFYYTRVTIGQRSVQVEYQHDPRRIRLSQRTQLAANQPFASKWPGTHTSLQQLLPDLDKDTVIQRAAFFYRHALAVTLSHVRDGKMKPRLILPSEEDLIPLIHDVFAERSRSKPLGLRYDVDAEDFREVTRRLYESKLSQDDLDRILQDLDVKVDYDRVEHFLNYTQNVKFNSRVPLSSAFAMIMDKSETQRGSSAR